MNAFDPNYPLLDDMYQDEYYPDFLVDKVKGELQKVIGLLRAANETPRSSKTSWTKWFAPSTACRKNLRRMTARSKR